ncbi:ketoacyl-synt-domain-containing protein [Xylaria palmicola]|nr:ketoacyl-synt-domain-containing protein [Xylaria palmicola]
MAEKFQKSHAGDSQFEPIAIVGAACRLPGEASSLDGLWNMMKESRTAHARVPAERWDADAFYHPDPDRKGTLTTTHGFFLEQDIAAFDAPFFSVTPKEASGMDPAKRLLLEVAYETFENAGLSLEGVAGTKTGVYVGSMTSDYELLSTHDMLDAPYMAAAGSSEAMTANRVSWFFDLRGPSLTLDTACSSSLYALHLACQSLRLKETNMGLVAGVNVILHPNFMNQLTAMHMLSPDGTSHTFDDRANGYGRGEGIGGILVKRLSDAIRDGDTIRAVIRGTGTNVDGKTPSVTMPSGEAQAALILSTYAEAGLPLVDTRYVEMHGTGTPVGDPIELSAISSTFGAHASAENPVYVSSIKPNIGHTEGCAGLAAVIKAVLCLEKGYMLPTANVAEINPKLRFAEWNLALPEKAIPWPTSGLRRISVNSFGFGGANAHVILDDALSFLHANGLQGNHSTVEKPRDLPSGNYTNGSQANGVHTNGNGNHTNGVNGMALDQTKRLFLFSSSDEKGLQRLANSYHGLCARIRGVLTKREAIRHMEDMAYTLAARRSMFDHRSFAIAGSIDELSQQLSDTPPRFKRPSKQHGIGFVYTGQGAQWAGMGRELLSLPVFAKSILRSYECLKTLDCPFDLLEELNDTESTRIESAEYSQPICTAVQIGLTDVLTHWGVRPKAVVGHSSGEIAAAYSAGIITHEDAIKVAYLRGVYSGQVARSGRAGAMLAAGISEDEAQDYLKQVPSGSVVTACINSPKSVTLSGDADYVVELEKHISQDGKFARKLRVKTAYHSPHLKAVAESCLEAMATAKVSEPMATPIQMFSSVTGQLISPHEVDKTYWVRNMCQPVRFSQAVRSLLTHASGRKSAPNVKWNSLVEIGPHSALKAPLTQIMDATSNKLSRELPYVSMLVRGTDAVVSSLRAAGALWALGNKLDMSRVNQESDGEKKLHVLTDLPSYPWSHERQYWHETSGTKDNRLRSSPRTDLLGLPVESQVSFEPQWRNFLRISENPWLLDHKITGTTLYPGAGMLIMVIEAVPKLISEDANIRGIEFHDVHFERGLVIPDEVAAETLLSIQAPNDRLNDHSFAVYSRTGNNAWTKHCFGRFKVLLEKESSAIRDVSGEEWSIHTEAYEALKKLPAKPVDIEKLYRQLQSVGMEYGPTFQNLETLFAIPDTKASMPHEFEYPHLIHPATLDAIFHLIVVSVSNGPVMSEAAVPYRLKELFISTQLPKAPGAAFSGYSTAENTKGKLVADLVVSDQSWGGPKIIVRGLEMKQVTSGTLASSSDPSPQAAIAKRCTKILWRPDPEFILRSAERKAESSVYQIRNLQDWLDIECHRAADLRVLVLGSTLGKEFVYSLRSFLSGEGIYRGFEHCTITDASDDALESWKSGIADSGVDVVYKVWDHSESDEASFGTRQFDLVIAGSQGGYRVSLESLASTLKPVKQSEGTQLNGNGNGVNFTDFAVHHVHLLDEILDVVAFPQAGTTRASEIYLLQPVAHKDEGFVIFEQNIRKQLQDNGFSVHTTNLKEASGMKGKTVLSLLDVEGSLLSGWNAEQFAQFQSLISSAAYMFWISQGSHALSPTETALNAGAVPGLLRVLRNEYPQVRIAHLDLAPTSSLAEMGTAELAVGVFTSSLESNDEGADLEWAEAEGQILGAGVTVWLFMMAFHTLRNLLNLHPGETVFIQNGATSLGQALLSVSRHFSINVFTSVQTQDEKWDLIKRFGIDEHAILDNSCDTIASYLLRHTNDRGVDAAVTFGSDSPLDIDTLGPSLGSFARLAIILNQRENDRSTTILGTPNISVHTVDPLQILNHRTQLVSRLLGNVLEILEKSTTVEVYPRTDFSVAEIPEALDWARGAQTIPMMSAKPPKLQLDHHAAYVLAGGLGSLGLRIANLMVQGGARHLVFLSRSGGTRLGGELEKLRKSGCEVDLLKCDVTSLSDVKRAAEWVKEKGKKIKGVIQCAMVLQDSLFARMSHAQWNTTFDPKVRGTRNLHAALPRELDFFVMLSSVVAVIGNVSQANYAAGNTYMDAFAHYRRSLGLSAVSINAGLVSDSDHTIAGTDMEDYLDRFTHMAAVSTTLEELDIGITAALRGSTADGGSLPPQFVFGMNNELRREGPVVDQWTRDAKFNHRVASKGDKTEGPMDAGQNIGELLKSAASIHDAAQVVQDTLKRLLAPGLGVETTDINAERPLYDMGVDSFKAVEIRNQVFRELKSDISVFEILSPSSLSHLSDIIASRSLLVPAEVRTNGS